VIAVEISGLATTGTRPIIAAIAAAVSSFPWGDDQLACRASYFPGAPKIFDAESILDGGGGLIEFAAVAERRMALLALSELSRTYCVSPSERMKAEASARLT
jgi:hypothetical protein